MAQQETAMNRQAFLCIRCVALTAKVYDHSTGAAGFYSLCVTRIGASALLLHLLEGVPPCQHCCSSVGS